MSDSDSELLSSRENADEVLEKGLRDAVAKIFQSGRMEELTVKRVRLATEKALGLEDGFFKGDEIWKLRSDRIIKQEAKEQEEILDAKQPKSAPVTPKRPPPGNSKPTKRALADVSHTVRKRQKTSTTSESEGELSTPPSDESEGEQEVQRAPKGSASRSGIPSKLPKGNEKKSSFSKDDLSDLSDVLEELEKPVKVTPGKTDPRRSESSESETSVLIDEGPKRKKQKVPEMAQTKRRKQHNKTKSDANLDQDQVEIKRLQGWLVKCGIRKMWFRELAPYNSPKAKIKHLKDMLKDAGMEGRYSIEKAKLIREERELQADLEMVQEGAKRWGTAKTDEEREAPKKPRRGLARGFKNFDFLGDDGEETD